MSIEGPFFDASVGDGSGSAPARYVLERRLVDDGAAGKDRFQVLRQFGYRDRNHDEPFVVPAAPDAFLSDLTSIPSFFRWLIPVVGGHLPAALLHDALCESARRRNDEERLERNGGHLAHDGPQVERLEADRIFRDAMGELGVSTLRRWLMWTAVVLATALTDLRPRWRWWLTVFGTLTIVTLIGAAATLNLFNAIEAVPWMGDRAAGLQLAYGVVGAIVIPMVLSLLWGRLWRAGMITCVALAFLLHVTVAIVLLTLFYRVLEQVVGLISRRSRVDMVAAAQTVSSEVTLSEAAPQVEVTGET